MAELEITGRQNGKYKQVVDTVLVDDDLVPLLKTHRWSRHGEYVARTVPDGGGRQLMHYFVWEHHHGPDSVPHGLFLDHRNQNKKDNRILNLEVVDYAVRLANAPKHSDNAVGYKDVFLRKNGRFHAAVSRDRTSRHLGSYLTELEAAEAVNVGYELLYPEVPTPNPLPAEALSEAQRDTVRRNVYRLLRPNRKPNHP